MSTPVSTGSTQRRTPRSPANPTRSMVTPLRDRVRLRRRCPLVSGRSTRRCHLALKFLACMRSTLASSTKRTVLGSGCSSASARRLTVDRYTSANRRRTWWKGMSETTSADRPKARRCAEALPPAPRGTRTEGTPAEPEAAVGLRVPQPSQRSPSDTVPLHPETSGSNSGIKIVAR